LELNKLSAAELIKGYREHQFSVAEVVESYIHRIKQMNETVNAVVVPLFDQARSEAKILDEMLLRGKIKGLLHGVPVTIKENIDVSGTPSTWGIEGREHENAKTDDPTVQRLRDAGAVIIAKTNAMQLLMGCETVNPIYGRTNNPWSLERTPGGSSGGEGASVASFFSPIGVGTDIGGSVRTPAHFCGIHALKSCFPGASTLPQRIKATIL
jgi:fatty acid amide hydrolase